MSKEEMEEFLLEWGRTINATMPDGWGFTLLMFDYGEDGNMLYLSSAKREDVVRSMQEFIEVVGEA